MGAGLEKGLRRKLYVALGGVGRWLARGWRWSKWGLDWRRD